MQRIATRFKLGLLTTLGVILALSAGCDAQLKAAVEDGIITASTSLLGALLRAGLNVALDPNSTS